MAGGGLEISNAGILNTNVLFIGATATNVFPGDFVHRILVVDGEGAKLNVAQAIIVGGVGDAQFFVENGAKVSSTGLANIGSNLVGPRGLSLVTIQGVGSRWDHNGVLSINDVHICFAVDCGESLKIWDGGVVSNTNGYIGTYHESDSHVLVGVGSSWINSGSLTIGDRAASGGLGDDDTGASGKGRLDIIGSGSLVSNTNGILGHSAGSTGSVTVDYGTWTNSDSLIVGDAGTGTLDVILEGVVNVGSTLTLAKSSGSIGTLTLGEDSVLNAASIHGGAGTATINFQPFGGNHYFTRNGTSSGNPVTITGSTAVNKYSLGTTFLAGTNTYSGATTVNSGTLSVNGSIANSTTTVNAGGKLGGTGTVGTVNVNGGTVAPGNSAGTLTVNGDFSGNGTLVFEIGGLASGTYDVLDIHGDATFNGGNVQINVINGYGGADGSWDFLLANTVTGWENLSVNVNGLPPGKWWRISPRDGGGERLSISSRFESPAPADNPTQISHAEISGGTWMGDAAGSAGFIPTTGNAKSPPKLPPGYTFPHSLFDFVLTGGVAESTATITFTYPTALPLATVYWKYGPSPDGYGCAGDACAEAHWYKMPKAQAVVAGNTMTLTITDGGVGDDDLTANGTIVDLGGSGVPIVTSIPTLSEWGMITLISLLALSTFFTLKRQRLMRPSEV